MRTISDDQINWLRQHHPLVSLPRRDPSRMSYKMLADHVGVCVDTVKRILVLHNIANFESEKYAISRTQETPTWRRPCMQCGCTKPRPRNKYICQPCKIRMDWIDED